MNTEATSKGMVSGIAVHASTGARDQGTSLPPPARPESVRAARRLPRKRVVQAAAALLALALLGWSMRPTPLEVETAVVTRGALETTVDAEGVTRVRDRFLIDAPVTGRLERITAREGDPVAEGEVLARITPLPLDPQGAAQGRARLAAAEAGEAEARARMAQAREAMQQAERTTARLREVAQAGGMSVDAVERAELQLAAAARDLQAAESRVRAAAAEVGVARAALMEAGAGGGGVASVRAPASGRVLRVREGSERIVAAGTPLVEVGDAGGLEVVVDVLSSDAVRISPGAAVRLVEWGGDGALAGRVRLVEPSGFTKVSTLGVEEQRVNVVADLVDPPAALGDGYRVEARIVTWAADDVLTLPVGALFRTEGGWNVFVVENGRARLRAVEVGHRGAEAAEVRGGVQPGEVVVLFPDARVDEGTRVRAAGR